MLYAKKSLGQNFLTAKKALADIVKAGKIAAGETVLEVGPGKGALTEVLLATGAKIIAVEKDDRLIPLLEKKFEKEISLGKLNLIHADILELDSRFMIHDSSYKLIANIPYYITGTFLRKFLSGEHQPSTMVILLQKEVAERIVTRDDKESLLSISVKAYGTPHYIDTVKAGSFSPAPSVDSAILAIENISKKNFSDVSEEKFFSIAKKAFGQKRKMISGTLGIPKEKLENLGIPPNARPEELGVQDWLNLSKID